MEQYLEKAKALQEDAAFIEKLQGMKSEEEVAEAITEAGVPVTGDEIREVFKMAVASGEGSELNEEDLDAVSGGCKGWWYKINPVYWLCKWYVEAGMSKVCKK